jgi:hypothetical protein
VTAKSDRLSDKWWSEQRLVTKPDFDRVANMKEVRKCMQTRWMALLTM